MANKTQLVNAVTERLGDRRSAAEAVDVLFDFIIRSVEQGERVTVTGFGTFEPRERAARAARNPRTGETVAVPQATVPAFRPGALFREVVSGARELPTPSARTASRPAATPPAAAAPAKAGTPAKPEAPAKAEVAPKVKAAAKVDASPRPAKKAKKKQVEPEPAKPSAKPAAKSGKSAKSGKQDSGKKVSGKKNDGAKGKKGKKAQDGKK